MQVVRIQSILSMLAATIFVYHGTESLFFLRSSTVKEAEMVIFFRYLHAIEVVLLGSFLMLVECNSPLFIRNIRVLYRPVAKGLILLVLSVFLYSRQE